MKIKQLYLIYLKHPSICTDTRKISASCLFFALKGDNFDGNAFADKAVENGAAFAIIDDPQYAVNDRFIFVSNVLEALQDLARFHRDHLRIPFIGITGSNGKTTTKELIRFVLSQDFNCYATEGNLNNHIGVPLSILSIKNDCEIAIIEMGANHQKEIAFLCGIAKPTHGLITNVGKAHLEGFGGIEGVKIGKGELYEFLVRTGGIVFINNDNPILTEMSGERGVKNAISYGLGTPNFITVQLKNSSPYLSINWRKAIDQPTNHSYTAISNLPGIYNFDNIAAAICIGSFFGLKPEQINAGINAYQPLNSRSQIVKTDHNTLICDYYNANPSSMAAALENMASIQAKSKVLILGDMFELGAEAGIEHQLILDKSLTIDASRRIFIGEEFCRLNKDIEADFYKNVQETAKALKEAPVENSIVLVKGSRSIKLENLLPLL